jgi:2-polyprenyl-3-methyl-5-hydroxy-6-metoxy-1,4-benzoquinol methylase
MHKGRFIGDVYAVLDQENYEANKHKDFSELRKLVEKGEFLEHITCPICSNNKGEYIGDAGRKALKLGDKLLRVDDHGHLVKCVNCSVVYAGVRYSKEASKYLYLHYIPSMLSTRTEEHSKAVLDTINEDLDLIEQQTKRGIILDVGTASGAFLVYARTRGWEVQATELSKYCKNVMEVVFDIDVLFGELEELDLEENKYQCISLRHTIEHIRYPVKELTCAYRAMKDDGALFISTPEHAKNVEALIKDHMLPYHIVNYTRETLDYLLKLVGFKIVHYNTIPGRIPYMNVVAKKVV